MIFCKKKTYNVKEPTNRRHPIASSRQHIPDTSRIYTLLAAIHHTHHHIVTHVHTNRRTRATFHQHIRVYSLCVSGGSLRIHVCLCVRRACIDYLLAFTIERERETSLLQDSHQ